MGTLIQTVFETQAAELRMLGYMGYDVTTFGNHEFDYRSKGLPICLPVPAPPAMPSRPSWSAM